MQLLLPAASFPTPAAPSNCGVKTPATATDSPDTPADSFASLLSKDSTDDDSAPGDGTKNTDAEQAAGMLAAMLWMQNPVAATTVPVLPTVLSDGSTPTAATDVTALSDNTTATGDTQAGTPFFGATNSRAFGKLPPASSPVLVNSFANAIGDQVQAQLPDQAGAGQGAAAIAGSTPSPTAPQTNCNGVTVPATTAGNTAIAGASSTAVSAATTGNEATPAVETSLAASVAVTQVATATPAAVKTLLPAVGKTPVKTTSDEKSASTEENHDDVSAPEILSVGVTTSETKVPAATVPAADRKTVPADAQEKIAPLPAVLRDLEKNAAKAVEKYFLDPVQKAVTAVNTSVGIAVAKVNAAMSSESPTRTKSAPLVEPSAAFVFSGETAPTATLTVDAPAPVATVRETLAAVISAVDAIERRADVQQKSVDLNFHVGNEKLGLRVELKDGAVHTTFRTESPEMSSALSREWHSVVPTAFAREVRLAEPVFHTVAASGSDSSSTSLGQGAQHQQREQPKAAPTFASALRREFNDAPAQDSASPVTATAANSSQLLNALA